MRAIVPQRLDDGGVMFPVHLGSWNVEKLATSREVEARLPDGNEVVLPLAQLVHGARLIAATKDSAFVTWAIQQAAARDSAPQRKGPTAATSRRTLEQAIGVGFTFDRDTSRDVYTARGPVGLMTDGAGEQVPVAFRALGGTHGRDSTAGALLAMQFSAKSWNSGADNIVVSVGDSVLRKSGEVVQRVTGGDGLQSLIVMFPPAEFTLLSNVIAAHQGVTLKFGRGVRAALSAAQREHILYAMYLSMSRQDMEAGFARAPTAGRVPARPLGDSRAP